jgi:hypothetical protein
MLQPKAPNINGTAIQISPEDEVYKDTSYAQSVWKQFQILCRRSFVCSLRDKVCYSNIGKSPVLQVSLRNLNKTEKFIYRTQIQHGTIMQCDVCGVNKLYWYTNYIILEERKSYCHGYCLESFMWKFD